MKTNRHSHSMAFGARLLHDGSVRFALWAPAAREVELVLDFEPVSRSLPMIRDEAGWFRLTTTQAGAGTLYRYRIDGKLLVPDPASRFQPEDVHGASEVIDPEAFVWPDHEWRGRPWHEAVVYELHVGGFTPPGTFAGVAAQLDYLAELGVTAIELMPVADFPGRFNWGYDGTLPFAPESSYGRPEDLKMLVAAAHARGLMVLLDVVYNHFGPEGNYLHLYAPQFFTERHQTPWGAAFNFEDPDSRQVREFFVANVLYWLEEFRFDGLRFDAVHAIFDDSTPHILEELAERVYRQCGPDRHVHLILENDANEARYLSGQYAAQWNDDFHHAVHVILTGETDGYYQDYAGAPLQQLGRVLCEGFAYQGEPSGYRGNAIRGEPSAHLAATAFVNFLQNHDQIGNRPMGERLPALVGKAPLIAVTALLLLAPAPPLVFMGQEWGTCRPFLYFCDFAAELAAKVTKGRREEFALFAGFADPASLELIPDPAAINTFQASSLDWAELASQEGAEWLALHRQLLAVRHREIVPLVKRLLPGMAHWHTPAKSLLVVYWPLVDGNRLSLVAALDDEDPPLLAIPPGRLLFSTHPQAIAPGSSSQLPPWSISWLLGPNSAPEARP